MHHSGRVRMRYRRDGNEFAVVARLRFAGWAVVPLAGLGGLPDLLCLHPDGHTAALLEVKAPGGVRLPSGKLSGPGRLTQAQRMAHRRLAQAGWHVHVVHTPEEALAAVGPARAAPTPNVREAP